ncbi:hypothetical protein [Evansella halocellulosilytica]|uniref:hypothetical protein n=1 Tax=Evansella halocellulosilytica TaxID=2011013 RepID=UPI0015CACC93|nr:hypothetical protein [Evansella halocellulosilytica]
MRKKTFLTAASTVLALSLLGACADDDVDVNDDGIDEGGVVEEENGDDVDLDVEDE